MPELKLTIELVPYPLWGRNLYSFIPRSEWDRLRGRVYAKYNYHCGICGGAGKMICHEVWEYDDVNHIQRLTDLIALCSMCNYCKHMGISMALAHEGKLNFAAVIDHFCRVNGITKMDFLLVRTAVFKQWSERNKYKWTQDFGEYSGLLPHG